MGAGAGAGARAIPTAIPTKSGPPQSLSFSLTGVAPIASPLGCGALVDCPRGHGMTSWNTTSDMCKCNRCASQLPKGTLMQSCHQCNYDLCIECFQTFSPEKTCPGKHQLVPFTTPTYDYTCNQCGSKHTKGDTLNSCRLCDHDLCKECFLQDLPERTCPGKHRLVAWKTPNNAYTCNHCGVQNSKGTTLYGCQKCNYDLCEYCF